MNSEKLGLTLKSIRIVNNLGVNEVVKKGGVSSSAQLNLIESGEKKPSLTLFERLSSVYDLPMYKIMELEEKIEKDGMDFQHALNLVSNYYINEKDKDNDEYNMVFAKSKYN